MSRKIITRLARYLADSYGFADDAKAADAGGAGMYGTHWTPVHNHLPSGEI
jgi:hypothetical protein